jgi:hypothetical protein
MAPLLTDKAFLIESTKPDALSALHSPPNFTGEPEFTEAMTDADLMAGCACTAELNLHPDISLGFAAGRVSRSCC